MKALALLLSFAIFFTFVIPAFSQPEKSLFSELDGIGVVPKTMAPDKLERPATRGECLSMLILTLEYGEEYRISNNPSFWARLWQNTVRFFRTLWHNVTGLVVGGPEIDEKYAPLARARLWGLVFDPTKLEEPVPAWEVLSMMSAGLSQSLSSAGVPRTLTQEVEYLSRQVDRIKMELAKRYQELRIDAENPLVSNQSWTYYLFSLQHDLLPQSLEKSPKELEKSVSCGLALEFAQRALAYLRQMADDLNK